jgi:Thoeris protein ThsB, TIR-like domain
VADPRAFISFDCDHNLTSKNLFVGQIKNSRTPFYAQDWSAKAALPQAEWERKLKAKINTCHLMIVLVGRSMGSAAGVAKEIGFAKEQDVPFFGVYVDGAGASSTLPAGLAANRTIAWDWDKIANAVDQMMREGKNK